MGELDGLDISKKGKLCQEKPWEMSSLVQKIAEEAIKNQVSSAQIWDLINKEIEFQVQKKTSELQKRS